MSDVRESMQNFTILKIPKVQTPPVPASTLASPTGVRYKPPMSCNPPSGRRSEIASKTSCEGDFSCEATALQRERAA